MASCSGFPNKNLILFVTFIIQLVFTYRPPHLLLYLMHAKGKVKRRERDEKERERVKHNNIAVHRSMKSAT